MPLEQQTMDTSQVIEWMGGVTGTNPSESCRHVHQTLKRASSPENGETPFERSRKRKRSDVAMADGDDDLLLAAKSMRQANQPLHPAPLTLSGFEREPLYPADSISQTDVAPLSRSSSPSKNVVSVAGSTPHKSVMLKQSYPKFYFLSASGRGGLSTKQNPENWVPASLQRLVSYLRGAPCLDEMVCGCVEQMIREHWPYEPWPKWNNPKPDCKNPRRHTKEADFVIETTIIAEKMHSKMNEEMSWVSTAVQILQFVAGPGEEFHPVSADTVG
ncbi:hypothetical protein TWF481_009119 [Arthrobotrys musiformis]|uniref:Uncharacterized protein n=1 Tax=Arthrobotrys musiformis TaxID=47236 RepID=A0AAV9W3Z4_9PEZI